MHIILYTFFFLMPQKTILYIFKKKNLTVKKYYKLIV